MQQPKPGTALAFEACENFRELGGYTGCGGKQVRYCRAGSGQEKACTS